MKNEDSSFDSFAMTLSLSPSAAFLVWKYLQLLDQRFGQTSKESKSDSICHSSLSYLLSFQLVCARWQSYRTNRNSGFSHSSINSHKDIFLERLEWLPFIAKWKEIETISSARSTKLWSPFFPSILPASFVENYHWISFGDHSFG